MNTPSREKHAFLAWARSIPLALGIPVIIWILVLLVHRADFFQKDGFSPMFFITFSAPIIVHFFGYLIVGLPIFIRFYRNPASWIWRPFFALVFGTVIGLITTCLLFMALRPSPIIFRDPMVYLFGSGYGLATAFAAYLKRPKIAPLKTAPPP